MSENIPEANIGLVGHVDHGKTTLTRALSGKWTDEHSEELKKGITIRIGYADVTYYKDEDGRLNTDGEGEEVRTVSLVDAPGHETLMANVLSGAALMDGAILLVAADEECPQPQTREHLAALDIIGIENVVIAQNKVDKVDRDQIEKNHEQIREFLEGTSAEGAPIVPISAQHEINLDALLEAVDEEIPTPERESGEPEMLVARSFDINKPGVNPSELKGGVVGGSLMKGELEEEEKVELKPGIRNNGSWETVETTVRGIIQGDKPVETGKPGGLLAVETSLDPSMAKSDGLSGNVLGKKGTIPDPKNRLELDVELLDRVLGTEQDEETDNIREKEMLMLNVKTGKSAGQVRQAGDNVIVDLKVPVVAEEGDRVAISRQIGSRWRLIGHGTITDTE